MPSQDRKKIFLLGAASNYGTTIVSILAGLISVPIGLHYFGPVRYGIWAVVSSVITYLNISNMGIPTATAVITAMTPRPLEQWAVMRRALFLQVIGSTFVLSLILGIVHFYPNWIVALGEIPIDLHKEAAGTAIVTAILLLVNLPMGVFYAGFIGVQKVHWERFYFSLTNIFSVFALILAVSLKRNLVTLALYRGIATIIVSVICTLHFIFVHSGFRQKNNEPISKEYSSKSIFASGTRFAIIGIAAVVVWNTDNLVISHFLGVKAVTAYAITFKLFTVAFSIFLAVNSALLPMYGKASDLKQWDWIQRTYDKATLLLPIIGGLIWIGGVAFAKEIVYIWAGPDAYGGMLVVFSLGGYGYLLSLVNIHATLLGGLNATKNMVYIGWAEAIVNIGISIALVGSLGIGGVALGTFLASLITVLWMLPRDIYGQTEKRVKFHYWVIMRHAFFILIPCLIFSVFIQHYWQNEISKIFINIFIIVIYLILSGRIISIDIRNLLKNMLVGLYKRIKSVKGILNYDIVSK